MRRRLAQGLLDTTPVLLSVVVLFGAFLAVVIVLPQATLRDSLAGALIGGLVTLVTTVAIQGLQARAQQRRSSEQAARDEVRIIGALARELAKSGAFLRAMTEGESAGLLMLLPHRDWDRVEVELGGFWHPHDVADLSLIYHQIESTNETLTTLGAPQEGMRSDPVPLNSDVVAYPQKTRDRADRGVAKLNRRGDVLSRRYGWPAQARPDWP